jgi:hypothetical protein
MSGETPHTPGPAQPTGTPEFTGAELREMILDDPEKAMTSIGQMIQNAVSAEIGNFKTQNTGESHIKDAYPDMHQTLQSPEFTTFFNSLPYDPTTGDSFYSPVSAYLAFEVQNLKTQLAAAEKAGFKQGQETAHKTIQASNKIKLLRGGGHSQPSPQGKTVEQMTPDERKAASLQSILKTREANT